MKYQIMIGILFTLLARRKVSATELASKYGVSVRSVYRYVDEMTIANIPIDVARGANGGIYISDSFKLPKGMLTREEYGRAIDAILAMLEQTGDPVLRSALEKLSAQVKSEKYETALSGNILVDCGTWGDERKFSEKLHLMERAVEEKQALEIDYVDREGERTHRTIHPHLLVYKQSIWYVYAYCMRREEFRLFKIGRMRSILETGETFERKEFSREDLPLYLWRDGEELEVRLRISPETLPFAQEWLGVENIHDENGEHFADVILPDDESLIGKILSVGAGLEVLSPAELRERVKKEAEKLASCYRN